MKIGFTKLEVAECWSPYGLDETSQAGSNAAEPNQGQPRLGQPSVADPIPALSIQPSLAGPKLSVLSPDKANKAQPTAAPQSPAC